MSSGYCAWCPVRRVSVECTSSGESATLLPMLTLCLLQVRNSLVSPKRRAQAQQGSQWRTLGRTEIRARTMASEARRKAMLQTLPDDQWDLEKK